jgi:hypothetical protein
MREARFAIGQPNGLRSTVWKFSVHKNEAYILTRMFGSDAKVSLHSSGQCQWSATDTWVKKVAERRNADRHITRWTMPRPGGSEAVHVFRIRIPETELRAIGAEEDLDSVEWLPSPPRGHTTSIECYFTPPSDHDPTLTSKLPGTRLFALQMSDRRWFVGALCLLALDGKDLEPIRRAVVTEAKTRGVEAQPEHRACAFTTNEGHVRGLIELCLTESSI